MPKVLIADDMAAISLLFSNFLKENGFDVLNVATSSENAIKMYEEKKPDLLVLDLFGMNSYSGKHRREINSFDVISELCSKHKAKIIVVTASFRDEHIKKAISLGAKDYFVKGQPLSEFLEKINKALK